MTVPQAFDSLIAKLIVTGASRDEALARARRALDEFEVGGMPTVLPFHRAVVRDPAFTGEPFAVHTRWIETEFGNDLAPYNPAEADGDAVAGARRTRAAGAGADHGRGGRQAAGGDAARPGLGAVGGRPGGRGPGSGARAAWPRWPARRRGRGAPPAATTWSARCRARSSRSSRPTVRRCPAGDTVVVLEAMKMEQPLTAHKAGSVAGLSVQVGQTVPAGEVICQIRD